MHLGCADRAALTAPLAHEDRVWHADFSLEGGWIATGSEEKMVGEEQTRIWDPQSGQLLAEPFRIGRFRQFSPDGRKVLASSRFGMAFILDLAPLPLRYPPWVVDLAKAVSGQVLNERSVLEPAKLNPAETIHRIKQELDHAADDDWAIWGRWFLADRATRTISPFSKITIPEYIENLIYEHTTTSLDEAEQLAYGNTGLLERISEARGKLPQAPAGEPKKPEALAK